MTASPSRGGSSVSARSTTPSLQLAKLVELLGAALPPDPSAADPLPFVTRAGNKFVVNLRVPLMRMILSEQFRPTFTPGSDSGFMRDMPIPPRGMTARIGGRLLHGSEEATSKAVEKLHSRVSALLDASLTGADLDGLAFPSMDVALKALADSIGESKPQPSNTASMVPVVFASNDRRADERSRDIGRVLTAIETVDGRDGLELMLQGIANKLTKDGLEDEVEETLAAIRTQRNRPGSQIREFLDFLDDEALSRVRLQVTMRLMDALASQSSSKGFKAYAARVKDCYERFAGVRGEALMLDAATVYGQANTSDLSEHLRKALFYSCLPVWAQWSVQLFETRTEPTQGFATVREVSYRFRVNGDNPMSGKSAFSTRLERLQDRLLTQPGPDQRVRRDIAELLFLHLAIPDSLNDPKPVDVVAEATQLALSLKLDPLATLKRVHASLRDRIKVVDGLADELIEVLKSKSNKVVTLASNTADKFSVSIHRDIVNWEAIESISPTTDILRKAENGDNSIAWFNHLTISKETIVPGSLASYTVKTELNERSLAAAGSPLSVAMERNLSSPVLPVRLVPYHWLKSEKRWEPDASNLQPFDTGVGIELQYDLSLLQVKKVSDETVRASSEQMRSASVAAFTILAYVTLWELQRRLREHKPDLGIALIRLQHTGRKKDREADADDANTAVYAASQAIEKALAREGFIKLQGVTTEADGAGDTLRWKRRGALQALLGGQSFNFGLEGALDKVALVTYVTRPCDSHPYHADADGYLFLSRTYVAEREATGATLKVLRMRSRLVENRKEFKNPQPVLEEIARLHGEGFKHVILLSHHFGNRHIGRAAERHAPHGTLEFMEAAAQRFPDVHLYTLRRDVFPATRLRKRTGTESAFEVVNFKDHQDMYDAVSSDVLRSIMPIYTFATLAVVGDEGDRPQSGFCTYFFDGEQRITDVEMRETVRQNILGVGVEAAEIRKSLISVLRAIHFMEGEKLPPKSTPVLLPVLDPYGWVNPTKRSTAGEIEAMTRRRGGTVQLSLPAVLAHVTKVLHKEAE
ncbi:hypothetical protein CTP10_R69620 (plasmid) [Cupriavidus sp. P-10]|uniref:hypothetical protein n=1 Tax=Cupriavidus sp. P-10 TaxID=2027911 RepID=UPI000EE806BC|nr:hypothetical protein [Cupriavidus sp. P-10]BDB29547.1 hypothetical protein CTP10_R69620 [Cupriavidus sp. P-10]